MNNEEETFDDSLLHPPKVLSIQRKNAHVGIDVNTPATWGTATRETCFRSRNTFVAMEHTQHSIVSNANHPRPVWTPSNLSRAEIILRRENGVDEDLPVRRQWPERVVEIILFLCGSRRRCSCEAS